MIANYGTSATQITIKLLDC